MNAKTEFLEEIKDKKLVCAKIGVDRTDYGGKINWFILKDKFSKKDFGNFCEQLDFEYDDGYGTQELYGVILFEDSYSDRYEYDGAENWENHKMPTVKQVIGHT